MIPIVRMAIKHVNECPKTLVNYELRMEVKDVKTIEELRAEYKVELSKTPYKEPSRRAAFAYDAVWTIALTLHKSISALQQQNETRNMSLEDFDYNNTAMRKTFMKVAKGVSFQGMS
ncbi:hypothetical protein pdam_00023428, partial [Pocillopora damicornis]